MTETSQDTLTAGAPELCRVSVIGGNTQADLALPATIPIVAMIDQIVTLIDSRTPDFTELDDAPIPTRHWTLARIGQDPIGQEATLAEAGVLDGELLVLRPAGSAHVPALFDDVIDAVARLTVNSFRGWTATASRWAAVAVAVAGTPAAVVLLVLAKDRGHGVAAGGIAVGAGVAALVAASIMARAYAQAMVATVLTLCALLLLGPGAALFVPARFGSAHALLACAVDLVVVVLAYRLTGVGATVTAATITMTLLGGSAAAMMVLWHHPPAKVGAGMLVIALTVFSGAARLAAAVARLPVPPVPTAGGRIDPADHEPRPTIEGIGAVGATVVAQAAGLAGRARAANEYQSGIVIGTTVAIVLGALAAADSVAAQRWPGVVLAIAAGLVLCVRGRAFADLIQTATLLAGGATTLAGVVIGMGLHQGDALIPAAAGMLVLVGAALAIGVASATVDPSPVLRRVGELAEYLLIIVIVPLALWTMDLYSLARSI